MVTLVTALAAALGVLTVLIGVVWLRRPVAIHDFQVQYLGTARRPVERVRAGALSRGIALLVLGSLCLLFAVVSV